MTVSNAIGKRIRETRLRLQLSQAQLAHPEFSESYISLIENGNRTPTRRALEIIARKLHCSVDYLVRGIESEEIRSLEHDLKSARGELERGNKTEALTLYQRVLSEPNITRLPELLHAAQYGLALTLEACGDLNQAIHNLVELRENHRASLSDEHRIGTALALTRCYRDRGDFELAIQVAEDEIAAMIEKGWTDHLIELGATLMSVFIERGDLLRAEQYVTQLLAAAEELGTPRAIVATNWNASIVAEMLGKREEALARIERAWSIQSVTGEPRNRARLHTEYLNLRLRIRPEEAAECREELTQTEQELLNSAASTLDLAYCYYLICRADIELGQAESAVQYGLKAISLVGDTHSGIFAECQVFLAKAYQMLGRNDDAATALNAAAAALVKEAPNRLTAEVWLMAAEVWQALGDQAQSREAFQQAMEWGGV